VTSYLLPLIVTIHLLLVTVLVVLELIVEDVSELEEEEGILELLSELVEIELDDSAKEVANISAPLYAVTRVKDAAPNMSTTTDILIR
jgi:hypothetical protein